MRETSSDTASLEPHAQYNNFRIDNLLWQSRFLFWQVAQLRFSGFLYYARRTFAERSRTLNAAAIHSYRLWHGDLTVA